MTDLIPVDRRRYRHTWTVQLRQETTLLVSPAMTHILPLALRSLKKLRWYFILKMTRNLPLSRSKGLPL